MCESCGGAWIDGEEPEGSHARPFLVPKHVLERDGAGHKCNDEVRRGPFLVHDFRTDLLLLRERVRRPFDFRPEQRVILPDYLSAPGQAEVLTRSSSMRRRTLRRTGG